MTIHHLTVIGSSALACQIAFQASLKGFTVHLYDIDEETLSKAKEKITSFAQRYKNDFLATNDDVNIASSSIRLLTDLGQAVEHTDMIIEAIPEIIDLKKQLFKDLAHVAPQDAIIVSTASTILPSQLCSYVNHPHTFLMIRFSNDLWANHTAEIVKHEGTDATVFDACVTFSEQMGMISLPIYKEQTGSIINSLLVPFIQAAQELLVDGVADVETIDKAWMMGTNSSKGPFAMIDMIGMDAPYNLAKAKGGLGDTSAQQVAAFLKEHYIDKGKLGRDAGEGFYTYPNPAYEREDFLK